MLINISIKQVITCTRKARFSAQKLEATLRISHSKPGDGEGCCRQVKHLLTSREETFHRDAFLRFCFLSPINDAS